jgi:hypothetical protein
MQQTILNDAASAHINDILSLAIKHNEAHAAVVVFDQCSELACILHEAYKRCLPAARFIDFNTVTPTFILETLALLKPADLVVLIQSTNFRLEAFRIRVELFKRHLKVIEHPHLGRMTGDEISYYIDSLAYDPDYFCTIGHALKARIDRASTAIVDSGYDAQGKKIQLFFEGGLESAKLNVGDYSEMTNIGGQFPIGEVFTEARDLECVHGRVQIFVFGDKTFTVNKPKEPIILVINKGRVTDIENSVPDFDLVLQQIREDEGEIYLRELGFGMNRAFTPKRTVSDVGSYERMCGIHLSLGAKHNTYNKPQIRRAKAKYHIDVFAVTESVSLDGAVIFQDGAWRV